MMTTDFIPVNSPLISQSDARAMQECLESGWISSEGPAVRQFEERFSREVGRKFGVAVSSGSAALDIAIASLDIGPGDEVITSTFTIISCVNAILRSGATPVFVDCDPRTWNLSVAEVEARITSRTKAILAVHIFGLPVDMDPLLGLAAKHGLIVIEDAAQMHGQTYRGRACGSFGSVSTFSFHATKLLTTGEGGMLLTDDPEIAERAASLRSLCFGRGKKFLHEGLGWNYRLTSMQAALGLSQLERLDELVLRKRALGRRYNEMLADHPAVELPIERTDYAENIYWAYGVVLRDSTQQDAEAVISGLARRGVGSRPFFWPMHEQPVLRESGCVATGSFPHAERIARRGLYLPGGLGLTEERQVRVVAALREVLRGA